MSKTAIRILEQIGNEEAKKIIKTAEMDLIAPVTRKLEDILRFSNISMTLEERSDVINEFETWYKEFVKKV